MTKSCCRREEVSQICKGVPLSEDGKTWYPPYIDEFRETETTAPVFHPEFGRFMLEATPGKPWGIGFKDLLDVEPNMKWR